MNIFELTKIHKRKQQNRIKVYDEMLINCHKKIFETSKSNLSICRYIVPLYKFGLPLYNQKACIAYIILKLRKNGFDIYYEEPNTIHISWERHKQNYYYDQDVLMLEKNPENANQILSNLNTPTYHQQQTQQKQPHRPQQIQQRKPLQIQHQPQQQNNFYTSVDNQPSTLQIEYIPEDNTEESGAHSSSYMTKYYKDLNTKYLLGT